MTDERSERIRQKRHQRQQRIADIQDRATGWGCGIESCVFTTQSVSDLIKHQARDHPPHTCKVCHRDVPNGFTAIFHAFEEHSRTEYVRAYGATSEDVKLRENIKSTIEQRIDVPALFQEITERGKTFEP